MEDLKNVELKSMQESIYIKPFTIEYKQNGIPMTASCSKLHDSVAIIIYNITRNVLVFVKQFRPPVYIADVPLEDRSKIDVTKYPAEQGLTLEMCAGIVDKDLSLVEVAKEEVLEECGYDVPVGNLEEVACTSDSHDMVTYYCEVTDDMKVHVGGGVDDEVIETVEMSVEDVKKYITEGHVRSPPNFMFSMYWFLHNKAKAIK